MTSPRELPPGTVLDGKWKLESFLGDGGTATVFAGSHVRNGLAVAVKVLHPELAQDIELRTRFLSEGYAANRVDHPGAVRVLDDGTTREGLCYLVMERLVGVTLEDLAARHGGVLPLGAVLHYALALCEIMAHAHQRGIVHRDLKPENVFVGQDGSVKVLDFGIAKVHERTRSVRMTVQDVSMGTPAFMPPEQALGRWDQVDARSDVYALGATLFTLLTGRLVHMGSTVQETMVLVSTRPAPPLGSLLPQLPSPVGQVIDRSLAFSREARFADAGVFGHALRAAIGHSPGLRIAPSTLPAVQAPTPMGEGALPAQGQTLHALETDSGRRAGRTIAAGFVIGLAIAALLFGSLLLYVKGKRRDLAAASSAASGSAQVVSPSSAQGSSGPSVAPLEASPTVAASVATAAASVVASASASASAARVPSNVASPARPPSTGGSRPCSRDPFTLRCK